MLSSTNKSGFVLFLIPMYFLCRLHMFPLGNARLHLRNISIHEAIRRSDARALARHLVANTETNIHDKWGLTPLHIAAEKGDARLVQILLGMKADPGLCSTIESGWIPPLMVAASHGHLEILDLLLEAGAPVDATDRWGNTAILKACSGGHFDCVAKLLKKEADPTIANHWIATCLETCASLGFSDILSFLLSFGHFDATSNIVQSALTTAASKGYHQCVEVLLNFGCPPSMKNCCEVPEALFLALTCCAGDVDEDDNEGTEEGVVENKKDAARCVTLLINAGARVTTTCLDLLHEVMCQNEGKYLDTTIEVLSATTLKFNRRSRFSVEYNAISQLILQLGGLSDEKQNDLINAVLKLDYKPTAEILTAIQDSISESNFAMLKESGKEPATLQNLSKLFIRSILKPNVIFAAQSLPLPVMMKKCL